MRVKGIGPWCKAFSASCMACAKSALSVSTGLAAATAFVERDQSQLAL